MASEKQIAANRLNALKGGVKTGEGKAAVRLNAVSHGLLSNEVLLTGENSHRLAALRQQFLDELQPVGELETLLVERIVSSFWRLRRCVRVEKIGTERGGDYRFSSWEILMRYETALERQIYKAIHELQRLQIARLASQPVNDSSDNEDDVVGESHQQVKDFFTKHNALIYDQTPNKDEDNSFEN
jgi:hypothetical protein